MKKVGLSVSVLLLVFLVVSCAPQATPPPKTAPSAPAAATDEKAAAKPAAPAVPAKAAWQEKWEKALSEAKKESRVMVVFAGGAEVRAALAAGMRNAYGLNVETVAGKGAETIPKILAERRAGLFFWDVWIGGCTSPLAGLKPVGAMDAVDQALILPDVTDPATIKKVWWRGELWWVDPEHTLLAPTMYPYPPLAINTDLVKPQELQSFNDLLDPKWKGKLIWDDPTIPGGTLAPYLDITFGRDFLRKLAKNEPILMRDRRLELDWLAHGKALVLLQPHQETYYAFKKMGTAVQVVIPKEGTWLSAGSTPIGTFSKRPHPNTTAVFVNWLLSKEGQTTYGRASGAQSLREDVPTDFLLPEQVRQAGFKYWEKEREEALSKTAAILDVAKEIFAPQAK